MQHMQSINAPITLIVLGVLFYLGIVIIGAFLYECPFQTPRPQSRSLSGRECGRAFLLCRTTHPTIVIYGCPQEVTTRVRIW